MGLEGIEIILGVEQCFGISISDEDASAIQTPRQLTDLVLSRISEAGSPACLSQIAFHRLRKALMVSLGVSREAVRPEVSWASLLPVSRRRRSWEALSTELNLRLPPLVRFRWLHVVTLLVSIGVGFWLYRLAGLCQAVFLLSGFTAAVLFAATTPARLAIPPRIRTIGATVKYLAEAFPAGIKAPIEPYTRAQVRALVHRVISDVLAVPNVPDDARFVEDLGL